IETPARPCPGANLDLMRSVAPRAQEQDATIRRAAQQPRKSGHQNLTCVIKKKAAARAARMTIAAIAPAGLRPPGLGSGKGTVGIGAGWTGAAASRSFIRIGATPSC